MVRKINRDARLDSSDSSRRDRRSDNRTTTQDRKLIENTRLTEYRKQFYQSVLPDLPKIPGWHHCWLTTNNPADSIQRRLTLGYELLKASEMPGWKYTTLKTGDYAGCVGVNEMVAAKLPLELFEAYMLESHHIQPQNEEEKLRAMVDQMKELMAQVATRGMKGIKIVAEDGQDALGHEAPEPPSFAEAIGEA